MRDYIAEIVEITATKYQNGLRVLVGEVLPPTETELRELILYSRPRKETDPFVRNQQSFISPQEIEIEGCEEHLKDLETLGGWNSIILGTKDARTDYPTMWKTFCLYVTLVEFPGWTPRIETTSTMEKISRKAGGIDVKTIKKYRERMPKEIALRARMPQQFLF